MAREYFNISHHANINLQWLIFNTILICQIYWLIYGMVLLTQNTDTELIWYHLYVNFLNKNYFIASNRMKQKKFIFFKNAAVCLIKIYSCLIKLSVFFNYNM